MQEQDQNREYAYALIVAAGSGVRAGLHQGLPKQYCQIGGEQVLRRTLRAFAEHDEIAGVVTVIRAGDEALYAACCEGLTGTLLPPVAGGATRQLSVAAGLKALVPHRPSSVLIHDAARPFISASCISATLAALKDNDGAIAAAPVTDTIKREGDGRIAETVERANLWRAQTPQTFRFMKIVDAHAAAANAQYTNFTDDASIAEWYGLSVALVDNPMENMKITTAEDLRLADMIARSGETRLPDVRTGSGFDVHAFQDGDHVTLCGIKVPHSHGVKAHSDGDVGFHALTDALLGTIGAGDIGDHFPPSDERWRRADSAIFLLHAAMLVRDKGGRIGNVDITVVCERPKIGPHREAMRARIADLLNVGMDRVSIKATTSEGMGFTGRREGLMAMATATVVFDAA